MFSPTILRKYPLAEFLITVTNDGSNTAASLRLYWNANGMGTAPIQTNNNSGNRAENPISSTNDRAWSLGSNGVSQGETKTGNNTATVYNDVTFWDKQLSDSEVTELYNSGTVLDATTHTAADTNLKGYWTFETDGDDDFLWLLRGLLWYSTIIGRANQRN